MSSSEGAIIYVVVKKQKEDRTVIGTTVPGKNSIHTIAIDGQEYELVEKPTLEKKE